MNKDEANKVIAEYMGDMEMRRDLRIKDNLEKQNIPWEMISYSESLDSLIPVWEKLEIWGKYQLKGALCYFQIDTSHGEYLSCYCTNSMPEAAAIATAKCILELNKGKE